MPLLEIRPPFSFSLRAEEAPPSFFSFVLTDMDGTRTYGCVLHLCEEVATLPHPAKTQAALGRAFQVSSEYRSGGGRGSSGYPVPHSSDLCQGRGWGQASGKASG